ncbi:AMP-binding protein [Leptospira sp. 201903071]|uniref:class I adenylate-forming enzyme family protein n=1 Tax=Leptospira ainazelensis TaxID=2810034 RepID=UPI0019641FEE|nr:AMP-binding protein [Leptospira ainazelensis]MBM9499646.1 AMP-binding protein [Leptospira ainazelensis]
MKSITIPEFMDFRALSQKDRIALQFEGRTWTYSEIKKESIGAMSKLENLDLKEGDRFGILDFNSPESLFLFLGAVRIGVVPVIINWRLTPTEIRFILKDSNSKILFYGKEFQENASASVQSESDIKLINISEYTHRSENEESRLFDPETTIVQLYTSGTTGFPKGVLLNHNNLINTLRNLALELPGFGSDSKNLVCCPFYHIGGLGYMMLGFIPGGTNYLVRKFETLEIVNLIQSEKITNALLVPAMIQTIVLDPETKHFDFSSLRNIQYGGSGIPEVILRKASDLFRCDFTQAYGLTETTGIATLLRFDDHKKILESDPSEVWKDRVRSAGRIIGEMEISILNSDFEELKPGVPGEICLKGINLGKGYWNRPEDNQKSFDSNGWFHTGDIGFLDSDGFLYVIDRKNDMILSKGENLSPAEIERTLFEYPDCSDLAVFGLTDPEYGEVVCVAVVPNENKNVNLDHLLSWAKGKIAGYKMPRKLFLMDQLPRNPSGKVLRRELRSLFSNVS